MDDTRRKKRLAIIAACCLAVIALAEAAARRWTWPSLAQLDDLLVQYQRAKLPAIGNDSIVLVGDSSLGNGVDAGLLSRQLGSPVHNLALTSDFLTMGDFCLVEAIVRQGVRPRAVVICHTAAMWPYAENHEATHILRRQFALDVAEPRGVDSLSRGLFERSALVRQSRQAKAVCLKPGRGLTFRPSVLSASADEQLAAIRAHDYWPQAAAPNWASRRPVSLGKFSASACAATWLEKTLQLLDASGVPAIIAIGPMWDGQADASREYSHAMFAWLRETTVRYQHARVLYDAIPAALSTSVGDTPEHLTPAAKGRFTRWFAGQLASAIRHDGPSEALAAHFDSEDSLLGRAHGEPTLPR